MAVTVVRSFFNILYPPIFSLKILYALLITTLISNLFAHVSILLSLNAPLKKDSISFIFIYK